LKNKTSKVGRCHNEAFSTDTGMVVCILHITLQDLRTSTANSSLTQQQRRKNLLFHLRKEIWRFCHSSKISKVGSVWE